MEKYPRLNNFPEDATREQLVEWANKMIDWASKIEDSERYQIAEQLERVADVLETWKKTYIPVGQVP